MGSQYIPPPEQNVVNVGDEISVNALNGIAQANPAITSTNPVATNNSVATAVSGKANLSGATFTGSVIMDLSDSSSFRLPTYGSPSLIEHGDIWINPAGRPYIGVVENFEGALNRNAYPFALSQDLNLYALKNGTAFTGNVTVSTQIGIGGTVAVNPANKLAIHSGNIVFTSGFGLAFGDGTTQTTAALPLTGGTITGSLTATGTISSNTLQVTGGVANIVQSTSSSSCLISTGAAASGQLKSIEIGTNGLSGSTTNISLGTSVAGSTSNILFNGSVTSNGAIILNSGASSPASTISARRLVGVPNAGVAGVNIGTGGTDTASTTAGDVWIATNGTVFNYRDGTGAWRKLTPDNVPNAIDVSAVNPALRLTQRGTGHVILIEDTNNPDTSAFWVNADGKVHIGFDPATFTIEANSKIAVDGGVQLASQATINHGRPFTDYNMEMRVVINGQTCYIPYRIA